MSVLTEYEEELLDRFNLPTPIDGCSDGYWLSVRKRLTTGTADALMTAEFCDRGLIYIEDRSAYRTDRGRELFEILANIDHFTRKPVRPEETNNEDEEL